MPQVKIYSTAEQLTVGGASQNENRRDRWITVVNDSFFAVSDLTPEKIVYRFFPMDPEDWCALGDRSDRFTVVEIAVLAGRSAELKTQFIETIFVQAEKQLQITAVDLEILLWEIPSSNYGLRGTTVEKLLAGT